MGKKEQQKNSFIITLIQ